MNILSDVNTLSHVHEIMAQFRGWKSEVLKEFQHEYLVLIYRNSVEIPNMSPKKKAQAPQKRDRPEEDPAMASKKRTAEDSVPELGTPKGPRLAYRTGEDPEGGKTCEGKEKIREGKGRGEDFFGISQPWEGEGERGSPGSSGSAGSVAETERRPAESVAERFKRKEQKARDAAASGSSGSAEKERREKNDASDEDNSKWERAEAGCGWNDGDQEDFAKAARDEEMEEES